MRQPEAIAPLAVSMGEPAGIGPDIILTAYTDRTRVALPPFVVFGDPRVLEARAKTLRVDCKITVVGADMDRLDFASALPVVASSGTPSSVPQLPGALDPQTATQTIASIRQATEATLAGTFSALVTCPIHKSALYNEGFTYPGHTEFLAHLCSSGSRTHDPVMMLAHERYRVVPLTVHIPLATVAASITQDLLVSTARTVHRDLQSRFGIATARIAVTGLNPHAGEDGTIGKQELEIIAPAIHALAAEGLNVSGPFSADTLFHPPHWAEYDCVIAMYHDQALIPIKTLAFDQGVNITLGLPIIRTSPDHGTALSLAGSGNASAKSFINALHVAAEMAERSLA